MRGTTGRAARVLAVMLALAPGLALAQSRAVRRYLDSAATFYEGLDYERALAQLERARKVADNADDDAAIALYEGVVLSDMGREDQAFEDFKTALIELPDARLPVEVAPKVEALFARARAAVKKERAVRAKAERKAAEEKRRAEAQHGVEAPAAELDASDPVDWTDPDEAGTRSAKSRPQAEARPSAAAQAPTVQPLPTTGGTRDDNVPIHDAGAPPNPRVIAWVPAVAGVLCGAGAGYLYYQARGNYDLLHSGAAPPAMASTLRDEGKSKQELSFILGGIGAAALVTAGILVVAGSEPGHVDLVVGLDRGVITVGARLP